jgi:hypothetical protein
VLSITARMFFSERSKTERSVVYPSNASPGLFRRWQLVSKLGRYCACIAVSAIIPMASAATPTPASVTLAWDPSPDSAVTGYRVHYGVVSGQYTNSLAVGNSTATTVSGLVHGVTYYFATTAYNASGAQSQFSNEISYQVAFSQLRISALPAQEVKLTVAGQAGHVYDIEATQDFTTWAVIGVVTAGASGSVDFIDENAASFPLRFYRLRATTP